MKGTISGVIPNHLMPTDEYGHQADVLVNPITTIARMNMGQYYQHAIGRMSLRNIERMRSMSKEEAWAYLIEYLRDCHPNYADLVVEMKNTPDKKHALIDQILREGIIYIQMSPFQKDIDTSFILRLAQKYPVDKTPVTYSIYNKHGEWKQVTSKCNVMIGPKYWILLHKMPDDRGVSASHVNAYSSPMKAGHISKITTPVVYNPTRMGEDENRKHILIAGPDTAAKIIGTYANSVPAKTLLYKTLLTSEVPSQLTSIPMDVDDMVKTNTMLGVLRHTFGTIGIEISPPKPETGEVDG